MSLSRNDHGNVVGEALPASNFELEAPPPVTLLREEWQDWVGECSLESLPASKFALESPPPVSEEASLADGTRASNLAFGDIPYIYKEFISPASTFSLDPPPAVTLQPKGLLDNRQKTTWIWKEAQATHLALESCPASTFGTRASNLDSCPASTFSLDPPPVVTLQPKGLLDNRQKTTWIWKEAQAIHITQESYVDPRSQSVVSIFRVPNFLKETKNKKAYVPQIVSLGPYHSNRFELSGMDKHKKRALHRMMTRFNNIRHPTDSENMESAYHAIEKIFQDKDKIRNSYEEKIDCTSERLAVKLTLDGCFTLEILRTLGGNKLIREGNDNYEPIFERRKIEFTGFDILNDILMLENQIPLIVLRNLLELELNSVDNAENFLFDVLVKTPGTKVYPFNYEDMTKWSWPPPDEQVHHFLGLLHSLIVSPPSDASDEHAIQIDNNDKDKSGKDDMSPPSDARDDHAIQIDNNDKDKSGKDDRFIPLAVELSNAGIKFQRCNGGIKKICFDPNKATIYLPPINVTDHTEVLFRNLIALEQCKTSGTNYVTCYLSLMNNLIDTEKDVAVLRNSAIVKNYLGSDTEVAELFNGLCKGVTLPPENVFKKLQDDVMEHYESKVKVWIAQFVKVHFSSPWNFLALVGAIIALLLTLVQTVFSILQVYH